MSMKMICPGCDAYTSAVYDSYEVGRACPYCGLTADASRAVLDARKRKADEDLTAKYLEAERRAGAAEKELGVLQYRLGQIESAFKAEPPVWD